MSNQRTPLSLCHGSDVKFGTSGVRGPVAQLSKDICQSFTQAFVSRLCREDALCVGIDLRPSSPLIAAWVIEQAQIMGMEVLDCGALPTPALAFYAMQQGLPAIMITGSHIPFDRNGMKFYLPSGEITKADEQMILTTRLDALSSSLQKGRCRHIGSDAIKRYQERYFDAFRDLNLSGKRIGVYQHSCVTRDLLVEVLRQFGAEVITLGRTDHFVALDTEAVGEAEQALARKWTQQHQLDAIITTDGDGDRPLIADENGHWLRGDQVGMLTCQALQASYIATPINSNTGLEKLLPNAQIVRTKIGSPFVIEAMQRAAAHDISLGFEAYGGVLLGSDTERLKALPTRDALLPILSVISTLPTRPISAQLKVLPSRHTASTLIPSINKAKCEQLLRRLATADGWQTLLAALYAERRPEIITIDTLDGVRTQLSNGNILHIRASGNANELRIYAESDRVDHCNELIKTTKEHFHSLFFDI